jgi:VWFA-related protein
VIIYTISTSTDWIDAGEERDPVKRVNRKWAKNEGDHVLDQLSGETGGRAFFPYKVDDLGDAFLEIGDELRHQYALAYNPGGRAFDDRFHTIRIQVNRKDVKVRARKGYYSLSLPQSSASPAAPSNP